MRRYPRVALAGLLALAVGSLAASAADDDEPDPATVKEAQGMVLKLADAVAVKRADVKAQAEAIHQKFPGSLKASMWVFKPRRLGGVGIGPRGDGIQFKVGDIGNPNSRNKFTRKELAQLKADLIRAGHLSRALAEVADLYVPPKDAAEWKKYVGEMKKGADQLVEAANSGDPLKVKRAAADLSGSCTDCHARFR
jgi:Cytochrome C'